MKRSDHHNGTGWSYLGSETFFSTLKQLNQSKQSIIWILLLLVVLFITAIGTTSILNLRFSQDRMSALRQTQLQEAFYANLDRIDHQHRLLERYTEDLAIIGALFWDLGQKGHSSGLKQELGKVLFEKLNKFPAVFGVGIWFDDSTGKSAGIMPSAFAYRDSANSSALNLLTEAGLRIYRKQEWFSQMMTGKNLLENRLPGEDWTSAYYNPLSEAAVFTLVKPIINQKGERIGVATMDWHAERIIDLVSDVEVTPNTFAYLIDRNNRKLSGLSEINDPEQAEEVIRKIQKDHLIDTLDVEQEAVMVGLQKRRSPVRTRHITVNGRDYALSYAATQANMLFGIGVPQNEIDAVLKPMRTWNYRILLVTGAIMLLLSGIVLFRAVSLMRSLQASYTDELTRLPNRARLLLDLEKEDSGGLILINLDDFKEINGSFGYRCGDYVLRSMADWLRTFVPHSSFTSTIRLYRLTADEFAVFGPTISRDVIEPFLEEAHTFLHGQRLIWQQQEIDVRVTQGAAINEGETGKSGENHLITQAEFALQQARKQKKGFLTYQAEQQIEDAYELNLLWAGRLRDALQEDRIFPYFQPIFDNRAGCIRKYECLVRMRLDDGEIASPGQFLDIATKVRLDREITRAMIGKSFAFFAEQPFEFSINLSYADLLDDSLTAFILEKLETSGIGSRTIFELLESDSIDNYACVMHFIEKVKVYGCKIAIDDFGTGYSNFDHLLQLNADIIKIDGSLIRNLDQDPAAFKVAKGIVKFAQSLEMTTVAEYVHSQEVQEKVRELNIDFSQGAVISMPQPGLIS